MSWSDHLNSRQFFGPLCRQFGDLPSCTGDYSPNWLEGLPTTQVNAAFFVSPVTRREAMIQGERIEIRDMATLEDPVSLDGSNILSGDLGEPINSNPSRVSIDLRSSRKVWLIPVREP